MRILKILLLLVVMMFGAVFAVLNAEPVLFNYYFGSQPLPLSLLLSVALGSGVIIGVLSAIGLVLGLKRENTGLRQHVRQADEEVRNLRKLPLQDQ